MVHYITECFVSRNEFVLDNLAGIISLALAELETNRLCASVENNTVSFTTVMNRDVTIS